MSRVLVAGGPRVGKSTLAFRLATSSAVPVFGSDSLIGAYSWSDASAEVAKWYSLPGPWIIEGVAVPRAIRKWLASHPTGSPADLIYYSDAPKVLRTQGQERMGKGVSTVWAEIVDELKSRGVSIREF